MPNADRGDALPLPPGLKLAEEVITREEEAALIALMEASGMVQFKLDPTNPRSSRTFGWVYENSDDSIWLGNPMPDGFNAIRDHAAAFAGVAPESLIECLLNRYEPGSVIQPHLDKPAWTHVIGVSLGSAATMRFRKPVGDAFLHIDVMLPPRSIYVMTGPSRHEWQHSLPPMTERRWSLTFRDFSDVGFAMQDRVLANG